MAEDDLDQSKVPERREHQRQYFRLNKPIRAELRFHASDDWRGLYLFLVDISSGGAKVTTDEMWPEGNRFDWKVPLSGLAPNLTGTLELTCEVRWNKSFHGGNWVHGLLFVEPSEQQRESLSQLVRELSSVGGVLHQRLEEVFTLEVELESEQPERIQVRTFSLGGLSFRSRKELPLEHEMVVRLADLGTVEMAFDASAKVQWKREVTPGVYEYGCGFIELADDSAQVIEEFIAERMQNKG